MTLSQQHINDLILTSLSLLKDGSNKEHDYLTSRLNKLLPILSEMKNEGFSFQHIVSVEDNVVNDWKFDMDDVEELERYIDNYTVNEICYGSPTIDRHMMTEDLLIVKSV